jgi:hypothetical protein
MCASRWNVSWARRWDDLARRQPCWWAGVVGEGTRLDCGNDGTNWTEIAFFRDMMFVSRCWLGGCWSHRRAALSISGPPWTGQGTPHWERLLAESPVSIKDGEALETCRLDMTALRTVMAPGRRLHSAHHACLFLGFPSPHFRPHDDTYVVKCLSCM